MASREKLSPLAQVVNLIPSLSSYELDQLRTMLAVGQVKLVPRQAVKQPARGQAPGKSTQVKPGKTGGRVKGNPSRKSQYLTQPLYIEYSRLKQVVNAQCKAQKLSFTSLSTPEKAAYQVALSAWLEKKSSFRGLTKSKVTKGTPDQRSAMETEGSSPSAPFGDKEHSSSSGHAQSNWADVTVGLGHGPSDPLRPQRPRL